MDIEPLLRWKEDGVEWPGWLEISDESPSLKLLWAQWDSLHVENGLLKRAWESPNGKHVAMQLVVSVIRTNKVLREMHSGCSGAHFGINKTLSNVFSTTGSVVEKTLRIGARSARPVRQSTDRR